MDWGISKADELGLECFVEASPLGSVLYSKYGFRSYKVAQIKPNPSLDEDNDEWKSCLELFGPLNCSVMKRPVNGRWPASADYQEPRGDLSTNIWENADQM